MKIFRTLAVAFLAIAATSVWAGDVVGTWEISSETPRGPRTQELTIHEADGVYGGTITGRRGEMDVGVVKVDDDMFSFARTVSTPNGDFALSYAGKVDGDSISGTVTTPRGANQFTGKRMEVESE